MEELEFNLGLVRDPRTDDKKDLDYKHSDLAGAMPVEWKEKSSINWKTYTPRNQSSSLSCVGQSCAKAFEILGNGVESAHPIYRNRSNYPQGGMWLGNAGEICKNIGTTKEALDVSQKLKEAAMNLPCDVDKPDKVGGYVFVNHKKIDEIAQAIELQGHCILTFHANTKEWNDVPKYNGEDINFGHAVVAVDYFLYQGEKAILIEDSARSSTTLDGEQKRVITEDYITARCSGGMYLVPKVPVPAYKFTKFMKIGSVGQEVKMLQIRLNIGADGLFGLKTEAAVKKFQSTNGVVADGKVGPVTRALLNK